MVVAVVEAAVVVAVAGVDSVAEAVEALAEVPEQEAAAQLAWAL